MVNTSGYCIRIYYNPRNPEKKILRVTLRAADRIEAADRGEKWEEARGDEERVLFRRENISSKQKQDEIPAVWAKVESEADEGRVEERIKKMRRGEGRRDPGRGGSLLLYGNLNFWA